MSATVRTTVKRKSRPQAAAPAPLPSPVVAPVVLPVVSSGAVFNSIIAAIVTLGMGWISLQQREAELARTRIEAAQALQGKMLTTVKKNTDGAITAALLLTADATRKAANKTKDPDDIDIADKAQKAYETQRAIIESELRPEKP